MHGNDEPAHGLRNTRGDCCAHNTHLHREHEQPVQEDVQDCADDRCSSDQCGRTVIAAEELKVDGKCRGNRKQSPPEYIFLGHRQIESVRAEKFGQRLGQERTDKRDDRCQNNIRGQGMQKRLIRTLLVILSQTDGCNGTAADRGQHIDCSRDHNHGHSNIDSSQRIRTDPAPDENAVHNGEQENTGVGQDRRNNILEQCLSS